ncbi:hypothetical protein LSAT2_013370 [Lamellibrachia satsuma]|nr:hypothetical protein LSAT2_013370 [Lamellibrachia satsuma]
MQRFDRAVRLNSNNKNNNNGNSNNPNNKNNVDDVDDDDDDDGDGDDDDDDDDDDDTVSSLTAVHDCRAEVVQDTRDPHLWETWLLAHGVRKTVEGVHTLHKREEVKEGERPASESADPEKTGSISLEQLPSTQMETLQWPILATAASKSTLRLVFSASCSGQRARAPTSSNVPSGVAFNRNGDVLVADRGNRRVSTYRRDGKVKFIFDTVDHPCAIASDATFMVIVLTVRRTIEIYRKRGKLLHRFSISDNNDGCDARGPCGPCGQIAVNDKDEVIVLDAPNRTVKYFTYEGVLLYQFRPTSGAEGLVLEPVGLCIDPLGQVIVSDRLNHIVNLYSERGVLLRRLLGPVDKAGSIQACVITPQGHLIATESALTGQHSMKIFRYGECECHTVKGH